jgi:HD-like signal output (HDOD) protein
VRAILFVDDEPFILEGLRSLLRKQRESWDMSFVSSGPAALEALAQQPRDVVVSDMRMPGMDGAELLGRVRELYPRTARVILSGQASPQDLIRARPVAQQILSKPCERPVLCEAIERLFKVQALLDNERIQTLVGRLQRLPLYPKCFHDLSQAMTRLELSMSEIVGVIEQDAALSIMVLSIANGGYFGRPQGTLSIHKAVDLIGLPLLQAIALSSDMFAHIDDSLLKSRVLLDLPERSLLKARLARRFVADPTLREEAFAAALLLDIGQVVLAQDGIEAYLALLKAAEAECRPLQELERERLGFTHAEVSGYLLGLWGLPARVVELVAKHHHPELLEASQFPVAIAVHVADVLVDALRSNPGDPFAAIAPSIRERPEVKASLKPWWAMVQEAARLAAAGVQL